MLVLDHIQATNPGHGAQKLKYLHKFGNSKICTGDSHLQAGRSKLFANSACKCKSSDGACNMTLLVEILRELTCLTHNSGCAVSPIRIHWEIKGRFRKRVVLANVPSFRFSFRGNIRRNHPLETTLLSTPKRVIGR